LKLEGLSKHGDLGRPTFGETLFDRAKGIEPNRWHDLVRGAGGSAYVVRPATVRENVSRFASALRAHYRAADVSLSYKTNYNAALVAAARDSGALSEVVSPTELAYAEHLGVPDREIVFNGPGKFEEILRRLIGRDITLIADSLEELRRLATLRSAGCELRARLGIRIAPELSFQRGASRFGIDIRQEEDRAAFRDFVRTGVLPISGIHLHLADDRSPNSYVERLTFLADAWEDLDVGPLGFIDCGGGYASAMPQEIRSQLSYEAASLEAYGNVIGRWLASRFPQQDVRFICEPGTGVLSDAGIFVTRVEDVKRVGGRSVAIVDGTYLCINPLRSPVRPAVLLIGGDPGPCTAEVPAPVDVYGNSCMEIDLLIERFDAPLRIGDVLVLAQKGAYASAMASPFIQGIPALYVLDECEQFILQRPRTDARLLMSLNGWAG
jgi:diaminopimelate decarboxylase